MAEPSTLVQTRQSLHAVAEHVLGAGLHELNGHIGLRVTPAGFGTPVIDGPRGRHQIRIEGVDVAVTVGADERRAPLTTIAAAAELVGIEPGAPADVYTPATPLEPDRTLLVDPAGAARFATFFAVVQEALTRLCDRHRAEGPATIQLWPEHFDLATTINEVNYGGSPGDDGHPLPYLYVGPWALPRGDDPFWNEPFGASSAAEPSLTVDAALAFFESGRTRLQR